jgi:SAM-dependent methyltransferase
MDYAAAVETAPPGWRHFRIEDVGRLPPAVKEHFMATLPAGELALARAGDTKAEDRVIRALFWTLVYHLEPGLWDQLAQIEPIHPGILAALPHSIHTSLDVGAGSGRLTQHLATRSETVIAIEPSIGLAKLLRNRLHGLETVAAWADALPIKDGWSQMTAACGAFGPDPLVLQELRRVTAVGGIIALISPEQPEWFEANGWQRHVLGPIPAPKHDPWIDEFFGPPDPPHELIMTHVT